MSDDGGSKPAPGSLALVQAFVNSADHTEGTDDLADGASAARWLEAHGVEAGPALEAAEVRRLIDVREALRDLLETEGEEPGAGAAEARLDGLLDGVRVKVSICAQGPRFVAAAPRVEGFLGRLAAAAASAALEGTWSRLKICRDGGCRWAFYDQSRNGAGAWCSMRSCGNRAKARSYRQRHRGAA